MQRVRLDTDEAPRICSVLLDAIERSLAHDRIHGDLSPFNVLYHEGEARLIDYPQAVDPRFNSNALSLLERDIANIGGYFRCYGIEIDAFRVSRDLWARFLRAEVG
jgi:RIO kinase 1